MDPEVPGSSPGGGTIRDLAYLSAHARYAAHTANKCGYAFRSLDGADGYLFEVTDGARRAVFAGGAATPYALNDAHAAAIARDKAFSAVVLRERGVAVLPGEMFFVTSRWAEMRSPGREPADALRFAAQARFPIFCKPVSASNGLYAEVIESVEAFGDYMARVAREHFAILIQPFVRAPEHRVFVLQGEPLFSYRKRAPAVFGDGRRSLEALVAALPRESGAPPLKAIGRDAHGAAISAQVVVPDGVQITLEGPANRAAGGGATALQNGARSDLAALALAAADTLGLALAGVDIFDSAETGPAVIEINSNPMIATLEDHQRWDLIEAIWRANFEAALR